MAPITEPKLAEGEAFVSGRSREKARELLARAAAAGVSSDEVRTTSFGYIVPEHILASDVLDLEDQSEEDQPEEQGEESEEQGEKHPEEFNPSEATVDEVRDYLENADEEERQRVLAAEAEGKKRKGILDLAAAPEGDEN